LAVFIGAGQYEIYVTVVIHTVDHVEVTPAGARFRPRPPGPPSCPTMWGG